MQLLNNRRVKRKRSRWQKLGWVIALAVIVIGTWKAWEAGLPRYRLWKQRHALAQAREFIEKKDAPNAQLALEVAMREVPGNPDTIRVAADMLEQVNAPQAMRLRRAVVQIVPDSAEDAAKLVISCLQFGDFNAAKDALSSMPPAVASQAPALRAALAYAVSTDDRVIADYLFQRLQSQNPQDDDLKHAHALLLLKHPDQATRDRARHELEAIGKQNPVLALPIHRELVGAALQRSDYVDAEAHLKTILQDPSATLRDRLQQANLDLLINHRAFDEVLAEVTPAAIKTEADALQLIQWILVQNRANEADAWLKKLPPEISQARGIIAAQAEIVSQLKDWDRLAALLQAGAWGPISKETVRLAMAAQTVDTPSHPSLRHETWELALASAGGNLATYRTLQRLAAIWQWQEESEQTLWTIARRFPDQTWAHQALFNMYREKKNTAGMRDIMSTLREGDGAVPRYHHDWALLTMLLEPTADWSPAKEAMKNLYESNRANATYATGYVFALAQAGKPAEAMAVVEKMSASERDYPPRQPYLAFAYGVARKGPELERAAGLSSPASLLPEENYLFTRARDELVRKPEHPTAAPSKSLRRE
jgi:hypothetical protein